MTILSKGIHSLTENDCLEFFEPVKIGIELILDQKIELLERIRKEKEAEQKIKDIVEKIK